MRNMQPKAVDDDRRVTMYYKKFRSLNLSALGLGALRLPMEKDNPKSVVRRNSCMILKFPYITVTCRQVEQLWIIFHCRMYGPSIFKVGAIRFYNID